VLCTLSSFATAFSREVFWGRSGPHADGIGFGSHLRLHAGFGHALVSPGDAGHSCRSHRSPRHARPGVRTGDSGLDRSDVRMEGRHDGVRLVWVGAALYDPVLGAELSGSGPSHRDEEPAPFDGGTRKRMLLSLRLVLVGLVGGMIYSAGLALAMLWGVSFFQRHMSLVAASFCASFFSWGIVVGLPAFGWTCGRLAGPLPLLAFGAVMTGVSVALILYGPATYIIFSVGMFLCGIASGSYALTFVVVGSAVPREYRSAAFGSANMAILAVGGLFFQPLIGILAKIRGLSVPDANSLSILIWAQGVALLLLIPLILCYRDEPESHLKTA
jgi:hypothetical protein